VFSCKILRRRTDSTHGADPDIPILKQAGADETWLHQGTANHLISFLEDNLEKKVKLTYAVTIRFLDGSVPLVEQQFLRANAFQREVLNSEFTR
jgi:hypothetical protein